MKKIVPILFVVAVGCAGEVAPDSPTVEPDDVVLRDSKADHASDLTVRRVFGGTLVAVYGDIARDLWTVMEQAGGFTSFSRGSLEYLFGRSVACVTNRTAAACHIVSRVVRASEDFLVTIHGRRFLSAASELFGAIARANGLVPAEVTTVSSQRFRCAKDTSAVWCGITPEQPQPPARTLTLSFTGLEPLGPAFVYEGWLITSNGPVSSGRFSLTSTTDMPTFTIDEAVAADSTLFVLTIEPAVGDDPAPADTHVLAGSFDDDTADDDTAVLTIGHPAALGSDFATATGAYILETPSSATIASDYAQGVWFVNPAEGSASLSLPGLPAGWVYEGWVVDANGPVSTGRFVDASAADDDGGGPAAGPDGTPPFPGQDFIAPPRNLIGNTIVISVEPEPDDSPAPFAIKPLVDMQADDVGPGQLQDMANNAAASPAGPCHLALTQRLDSVVVYFSPVPGRATQWRQKNWPLRYTCR